MSEIATLEKVESSINKTAIREFAVNARRKLKERVELQANKMGFFADNRPVQFDFEDDKQVKIGNQFYSKKQIDVLKKEISKKTFNIVIDEVAYTWFNRFIALYYMELHNYIDNGLNVVSSLDDLNKTALNAPNYLRSINKTELFEAVQNNDNDKVYMTLIKAQCNELNSKLPFLFEEIENYTELLFPTGMLNNDSFVREMLELDKSNWQEVEIIGWLYQYYNQAEKDRVIQAKKRYKTNEIPYATQLFTPKWIVKYMTQNSLGRLWQEAHSSSNLKNSMEFYLEPRSLTDEDKKELENHIMKGITPDKIKVFDPACGSGHILVYAYSLLYQMYKESGYIEEEIPSLILKNNLFGLDLCKRAAQLAQLAVLLRARQDDKNIFDKYVELNIRHIEKSDEFTNDEIVFIAGTDKGEVYENIKDLIETYRYADIYGSLCKLPNANYDFYAEKLEELKTKYSPNVFINKDLIYTKLLPLVKQLKIMKQQYECVITNPPYMGNKYMESKLAEFIQKEYPSNKSDLFSAFMEYIPKKTYKDGQIGLVTPFVWMFIKSYEELRNQIINSNTLSSIVQLEYNAFEAACVPVATFTLRNYLIKYPSECIKLSDFTGAENQPIKTLEAIKNPSVNYRYTVYSEYFKLIPSCPIAYWASEKVRSIYKNEKEIKDYADVITGMTIGKNDLYLRYWCEVDNKKIASKYQDINDIDLQATRWIPYLKGGGYRKWYGLYEYVVDWSNSNKFNRPKTTMKDKYLKKGLTWSFLTSYAFSARYFDNGFLWDVAGSPIFIKNSQDTNYICGLLGTNIARSFLNLVNPTLNFQKAEVESMPIIYTENQDIKNKINILTQECINISKEDWDSFETSWDFEIHPLIRFCKNTNSNKWAVNGENINNSEPITMGDKIEDCYLRFKNHKKEQFNKLKSNEEELNRLFNEIYGLQEEMAYKVADKDISISIIFDSEEEIPDNLKFFDEDLWSEDNSPKKKIKNKYILTQKDVIKSLLSYAVGCMLGRYSLDEKGLAFAGGTFDSSKYKALEVDEDGIIPVLADTWFEDDIIEELKRFLSEAFGAVYLTENLNYIAKVLKPNSTDSSESIIRNYYLKDFYKDHLQTYKKRPIYWLFTSGKEKAFNCLVYLHRYDKTTLSRIRKDYLHEFQAKLDRAISQAEDSGNVKLSSQYAKYHQETVEYDAKLKDLADEQIELNLDDGVKVNYAKFKGLLEAEKDIVGKEK